MNYFDEYYKGLFRFQKEKDNSFLYELALQRGKSRGWYPNDWTVKDYKDHLFGSVLVQSPETV